MKHIAWIWIVSVSLVACGNTNNVHISAPGVVSGSVKVVSLSTNQLIVEKQIINGTADIAATEMGFGLQPVEILIQDAVYEDIDQNRIHFKNPEYFSAAVGSDFSGDQINVNPLTTLASCRLKKTIQIKNPINPQIKIENDLIAAQFKLSDLVVIEPATDFSKIDQLTTSGLYGILLGGFDQLAKEQGVSVSEFIGMLCLDVGFDAVFNGVGRDGVILNHGLFDEQVLKIKFAQAIYDFSQKHMASFTKLPMSALANEISMSLQASLFAPGIVNYSFDH